MPLMFYAMLGLKPNIGIHNVDISLKYFLFRVY